MVRYKRLGKSGAVTIPKDIRGEVGIFAGQALELEVVPYGIFIKKHISTCYLCGNIENLVTYGGIEICKNCSDGIKRFFEERG